MWENSREILNFNSDFHCLCLHDELCHWWRHMCRSVHTGKAGGSYWVCFATVGTVLQSSLLLCIVLHCFILLCTVLYYFELGLFCNGANIFGTLSSTPCVYFMLNLNNFSWQFAKIFLNELKIPPFLYSGSEVHYWLLIVKKITFNGIVLFLERLLTKSFHRGILALLSIVAFF